MFKPKHDYDGNDFYKTIEGFAMSGFTDAEVANELDIEADVFGKMKNGNYGGWNKKQNKERSARICRVLARARTKTTAIVRGRYLKAALGGIKINSKVNRRMRLPDGTLSDEEEVQTSEQELPPNMQALSTWLYHHDPEWRKIERKQDGDSSLYRENGIDIEKWMEDNTSDG